MGQTPSLQVTKPPATVTAAKAAKNGLLLLSSGTAPAKKGMLSSEPAPSNPLFAEPVVPTAWGKMEVDIGDVAEGAAPPVVSLEIKQRPESPKPPEPEPSEQWDAPRSPTYGREQPRGQLWKATRDSPKRNPATESRHIPTPESPPSPEQPVIQLKDYEDRSRGDRGAAPRMLYDPKSGSMVSATAATKKKKPLRRKIKGRAKKLPRTCGVLYERLNSGTIRSADKCDGDLGYGAHSVPGGRHRNPQAYEEYQERKKAEKKGAQYNDTVQLATGYHPTDEAPLTPEPLAFVTADDKLEILTDDAPTLKPTAKVFAPSQAALAAAAAVKDASDEEADEDDDDVEGLGFDPTSNMSGIMESPANSKSKVMDPLSVDFDSLKLDTGVYTQSSATPGLFDFGSTWGKESTASSKDDDWNGNLGGTTNGLFGDSFGKTTSGSHLLNLATTTGSTPWGDLGGLLNKKTGD